MCPPLHPRPDLTDVFSTFLQFSGEHLSSWAADPRLRQSMRTHLEQPSEASHSKHFWALYWHKLWKKNSSNPAAVARLHLFAYLQEAAYWSAYRFHTRLTLSQYQLSDYFEIAMLATDAVLKRFKPGRGTNLEGYALVAFRGAIADVLKQKKEIGMCSNWALLYSKLSTKGFKESLANYGLTSAEIAKYQLAWMCFKQLYEPTRTKGTGAFAPPPPETWEAIAQRYNTERDPGTEECSAATMEEWLKTAAKEARAYLFPPIIPLNLPTPGQEQGEWIDNFPDPQSLPEIQTEEEETQHLRSQINAVLVEALPQLEPVIQQAFQLHYGQGIKQEDIALEWGRKQFQIARLLQKGRKQLLKAIALWSKEELNVPLNSDRAKDMSNLLKEWLREYYQQQ